jgi:hypothetical protein
MALSRRGSFQGYSSRASRELARQFLTQTDIADPNNHATAVHRKSSNKKQKKVTDPHGLCNMFSVRRPL